MAYFTTNKVTRQLTLVARRSPGPPGGIARRSAVDGDHELGDDGHAVGGNNPHHDKATGRFAHMTADEIFDSAD